MNVPIASTLFDPTAPYAKAGEVVHALQAGKLVAVEGPPGSGRNTLVERLAEELGSAGLVVRVPSSEDADAPIHALLQTAAGVGSVAVANASNGRERSLRERVQNVFRGLAQRSRQLVLYVPDRAYWRNVDDDEPTPSWLDLFLATAREEEHFPFALVVPAGTVRRLKTPNVFGLSITLPRSTARLEALDEGKEWGSYAPHAARLAPELRKLQYPVAPIQVRLMVGLVGMGVPVARVAQAAKAPEQRPLDPLLRQYTTMLSVDGRSELRSCVRRFLLPRIALSASDALRLAKATPEAEPLLRHCLAYENATLRVPHYVRSELLDTLPEVEGEDATHKEIADHHKARDSARSADAAAAKSAADLYHWLEKVHHLGQAGALGAAEWADQTLESREFLIDRARSLSITHRPTTKPRHFMRSASSSRRATPTHFTIALTISIAPARTP